MAPHVRSPTFARPRIIATLLAELTAARRAGAFALPWLGVVTVENVQAGGVSRSTLFFAGPADLVACTCWRGGFLLAAIAVIAAWHGGAMPERGSTRPLRAVGLLAFRKPSIDAVVGTGWGRRHRRRTLQHGDTEDLPRHGGR